jgi:hypothetical protein
MIVARLLLALGVMGGTVERGFAPHYAPGLMERIAVMRELQVVPCMVSSPRYRVGTWLTIYGRKTGKVLSCNVADVSAPKDTERHLRTKRVVELGWPAAQILCGFKHVAEDRPEACPVLVVGPSQE